MKPNNAVVLSILLFTIGILTLVPQAAAANEIGADSPPGRCEILTDEVIRFPFEIYRGDIRFQCEVNGHEVHMLLDDGFMWDQLLFWGSPAVDSLGLEYDGEIGVGREGSDQLASKTASGITVGFPGVEFTEQAAVVTPYSSGNALGWSGSVGQISAAFFKHFVVDINFDSMQITLIEPDKFRYGGAGVEIPWEPRGDGPQMIPVTMKLADGRDIPMKVLMDLGYNDQLLLATGGENDIAVPEKKQPASLGFNIQREETRGYIGRLPRIDIGGLVIDNPIVSYVSEDCTGHTVSEAMIGLGLLSRFNLTFDYYRQRMFVEPNGTFTNPFEHDMTGMTLGRVANGSAEILSVYDSSPASEAGLLAGDRVISINGRAAGTYDIFELRLMFREDGSTVNLVTERAGEIREVSFILRRLI